MLCHDKRWPWEQSTCWCGDEADKPYNISSDGVIRICSWILSQARPVSSYIRQTHINQCCVVWCHFGTFPKYIINLVGEFKPWLLNARRLSFERYPACWAWWSEQVYMRFGLKVHFGYPYWLQWGVLRVSISVCFIIYNRAIVLCASLIENFRYSHMALMSLSYSNNFYTKGGYSLFLGGYLYLMSYSLQQSSTSTIPIIQTVLSNFHMRK